MCTFNEHLRIFWKRRIKFMNATPGYHQDIFRLPTLLKMRFKGNLFLKKYTSHDSFNMKFVISQFSKKPSFRFWRSIFKEFYLISCMLQQIFLLFLIWEKTFENQACGSKKIFARIWEMSLFQSHSAANFLLFGGTKIQSWNRANSQNRAIGK